MRWSVVFVAAVLAGCAGSDPPAEAPTTEPVLEAVITAFLADAPIPVENASVVVPLGVVAIFDGAGSRGANLLYAWSIGNATGDGISIDHAFEISGLHAVNLTVTSGNQSAHAMLLVQVPEPPASGLVWTEPRSPWATPMRP